VGSKRGPLPEIEVIWEAHGEPDGEKERARVPAKVRHMTALLAVLSVVVAAVTLTSSVFGSSADQAAMPDGPTPTEEPSSQPPGPIGFDDAGRLEASILAKSLPEGLVAAELFRADPGPRTLRPLLTAVGGLEGLVLGTAEGTFDLVTFDPLDPDRLLAAQKSSYGPAENQATNQRWYVSGSDVSQTLFAPSLAHDFAQFTADGTVAVWANSGNTTAFASRTVTLRSSPPALSSKPIYASRSVIVDGTLFALTGSEDYYSTSRQFESLIADRGGDVTVLDSGERWSWIDSPQDDIVISYPTEDGVTTVWDATTFERVTDHPLAGLPYQRLAVSGNGQTAVGVTYDNELEVLDATTGTPMGRFGSLNPEGTAQPITLNEDGTIAITVDFDGTVSLWWVGQDRPVAVVNGDAGPARVLAEYRAPRTASAVEPAARRIALRQRATPATPTTWQIIDTDPNSWIQLACELAGRPLTPEERRGLGLTNTPPACR